MPFKFKLEMLLRMRKEEEREASLHLQELRQKENVILQRISFISDERKSWVRSYTDMGKQEHDSSELLLIEQYLGALDVQRMQCQQALGNMQAEISSAMEELQRKMTARKQLDHLRENQYEAYMHELQKKERKQVEEIVSLRFSYNQGAGEAA